MVVTVNDIPASCNLGTGQNAIQATNATPCTFHYRKSERPAVYGISPMSGTIGTIVTITGDGFSTILSENVIMLGATPCVVTSATSSAIQCEVGQSLAGPQVLSVRVESKGTSNATADSDSPLIFMYTLSVTAVSPNSGSLAGGTNITITGDGFAVQPRGLATNEGLLEVKLGTHACRVLWSNRTTLECTTSSVNAGETADVVVTLNGTSMNGKQYQQVSRLASAFSYSEQSSPKLTSVSPASGGGGGGTVLTLTGQRFSTTASDVTVTVRRSYD